jgi:hypothetical protein
MSAELHPAATHHLPAFVTPPGETDIWMMVMAVFLVVAVMAVGTLFLRLHTLPERMAHREHKLQFEIVAVLGLLALFTHMHIFWVAGLLLALIDLPDFGSPLRRMASSLERLAGVGSGDPRADTATNVDDHASADLPGGHGPVVAGPRSPPERARPVLAAASPKELTHA